MSKSSKSSAHSPLSKIKSKNVPVALPRRPWIPLAATTAATFSLAGCSWVGMGNEQSRLAPTPLPPSTAAPAPAALTDQIKQYADNMNVAIDAQEKQKLNNMTKKSGGSVAAGPTTQPSSESSKDAPAKAAPKMTANQSATADTPIVLAAQTHDPEPISEPAPTQVAALDSAAHGHETQSAKPHEAVTPPAAPTIISTHADPHGVAPESVAKVAAPEASNAEPTGRTTVAMAAMAATAPPAEASAAQASAAESALEPLLGSLRQRVQAHPQNLQYALALNLLESAESGKTPEAAPGVNSTDQKFLTELTSALLALTARPVSPNASFSERAAPLLELAKSWQADVDLSLPKLALASRVDSFGVYTPVEPKFETGKRHVVIIYCEVANFTAKKTEDGQFQTRLAQQDTLITDDGLLVWRPNPEDVEDISRNQRRDFYLVKKLTIPDSLAIGKYTLRMSVTDKLANKVAMLAMPIEITPSAK